MRVKISIDTVNQVKDFVNAVSKSSAPVNVVDGCGHCVNAKSIMGMLYSLEFEELWCECPEDIYTLISEFII